MIRGFWRPNFPLPLLKVRVWLDDPAPFWAEVVFVVDTGASHSVIHPGDATHGFELTLEDLRNLPWSAATYQGVGGAVRTSVQPASLAFDQDDGTLHHLIGHTIRLAEPTASNQALPSLLGWDILRHFTLLLNDERIELTPR